MTELAPRAGPKRDRYGRYLLTHPVSGREVPWTRATTLAETLEDQAGLTRWKIRQTILGIAAREDLQALAFAADPEDKKSLDNLAEQAQDAAGSSTKANLGTALHKFTERVDAGRPANAPGQYRGAVEAYRDIMTRARLQVEPGCIERITCVPELLTAGTMDRIARLGRKRYIADLKTGADLKRSWGKIAIQLALYSRGHGLWNAAEGSWEPMPPVDQTNGIVIHLPAGKEPALYWVDLNAGWEAAQLCYAVREWRKRKDLTKELVIKEGEAA